MDGKLSSNEERVEVRAGTDIQRISAEVDAVTEQQFWMHAQSSSIDTVWGEGDDQLFAVKN